MRGLTRKNTTLFVLTVFLAGALMYWFFVVTNDTSVEADVLDSKGTLEPVGDGTQRYSSGQYGFTFLAPEGFSVGEFDEAGGRMILVNAENGETAFQIFITPFDDSAGTLTIERIQEDVPGLSIREPENMSMTGGQSVLTFIGDDSAFGTTREVWIVHKNNLFQVVTMIERQDDLARILETWELF